jgi:hypothetical protein
MQQDPMKEALNRKRGKGIDLTIAVGSPQGEPDGDDKSDLAPKTKTDPSADPEAEEGDAPHEDKLIQLMEQLKEQPEMVDMFQKMLNEQQNPDPSQDQVMQESVEESMTPNDQQDLKDRKPRSLGDRVKQAALSRMKK